METHWRSCDYRIESLRATVSGLETSIQELEIKLKKVEWYDGLWFLEETEPIYGLAFVALQNYINSSIFDRYENLDKHYFKYKIGDEFNFSGRTEIELIIALANYFKHRDHPKDLFGETPKIMKDFNLEFEKRTDIGNSPIFKGIELFSPKWELSALTDSVKVWREKLWEN